MKQSQPPVCHYERLCVDVNNNQHAYSFFSYEDTMYMYPHLLYILFIYCTLIKHCLKMCMFLSGGHSPGNNKDLI
jgi:hypothetical protein